MRPDIIDEDPSFPENEGLPARKLDYLGYAPCPIRAEMQRRMHAYFRAHEPEFGPIDWFSPAGCFHGGGGNDPYDTIWQDGHEGDMPGVISDGGSSDFLKKEGHDKWIATGVYGPVDKPDRPMRAEFAEAGIIDPLGAMHLYAAFPTVMLVDTEKLGDRPMPTGWSALVDPIYAGDVTLAGHGDGELSDNLLFNTWKHHGEEGLKAIAANVKQFWSPAQMVKAAGAGHADGTAIYTLNLFFALGRRRQDKVKLVWPEEGALFQPLMVLGKRNRRPVSQLAIDFLMSPEWGRYLDSVGFPAVYSYPGQQPLPGKLSWVGWDFLRGNDLEKLRPELNAVFKSALKVPCS
jgi:ABC-type Fe3+ transport system substrate-binding protein